MTKVKFRKGAETSKRLYLFLREHADKVFTLQELAETQGLTVGAIGSALARLNLKPQVPIVRVGAGCYRFDSVLAKELQVSRSRKATTTRTSRPVEAVEATKSGTLFEGVHFLGVEDVLGLPPGTSEGRLNQLWLLKDEEGRLYVASLKPVDTGGSSGRRA